MARPNAEFLIAECFPQALWHRYADAKLGGSIPAIGSLRYYRFNRTVSVDELVMDPVRVRWSAADGRGLPADIQVEAWDDAANRWRRVLRRGLPLIAPGKKHRLALGGVEARFFKLTCLSQYPAKPSSSEMWANPHYVPYATLSNVEWRGRPLTPRRCDVPVAPPLRILTNRPKATRGLKLLSENDRVQFTSPAFSAAFSLRRPILSHLGWDSAAAGKSMENLLFHRTGGIHSGDTRMISGPFWNALDWNCPARYWGGEVSVEGNVVSYRNLHPNDEVALDAEFEVRPDGFDLHVVQRTDSPRQTLELEAWRFLWKAEASIVATLGTPRQEGRTGAVELPAIWAAPGFGNLSCRLTSGDAARLQVDTWRKVNVGWAGIVLGPAQSYQDNFQLGQTERSGTFEFRVADLVPNRASRKPPRQLPRKLHAELRRNWGPGLMFRAELAGFSNNALSTNCHLSQTGVTDLAAYTAPPPVGPKPIELARYTATLALKEGRGYGDNREVYQDSDPSVLNMTGRIHQVAPSAEWLEDVWPFIRRTAERILAKVDRRGLVVAALERNAHTHTWVTNAWDCVNFGHYDAYSNAETYRAFRNAAALAVAAGDSVFGRRVRRAADHLQKSFAPCFYNPKTGWFGSWRSQDGKLHDYGHLCVNGPACLYGLVPRTKARRILERMEAKRLELGLDNFRYGLPMALMPVGRDDYWPNAFGSGLRDDGLDAFGVFCNGCLTLALASYYIRAMTVFGFRSVADQMAREILEGHALGRLVGGVGTGVEYFTHEGIACGYEGVLVLNFTALLPVAQHLGLVKTLTPEFWPD